MSNIDPVGNQPNPSISPTTNTTTSDQLTFIQDTLVQSLNSSQLNALFPTNPNLSTPNQGFPTLAQFISTITQSSLEFRHQLSVSDFIDQLTRRKPSQSAALQAAALAQLFAKRDNALQQETDLTQAEMNKLTGIQTEVSQLKDQVDQVNQGNAEEQARAAQQLENYNQFIDALKTQLGASENSDGTFTIPPGSSPDETASRLELYNQLAAQYSQQTRDFNSYVKTRRDLLNQYNTEANAHNDLRDANQRTLDQLINTYQLTTILDQNQISLQIPSAETRDVSELFDNLIPTQTIDGLPADIEVGTPPAWVETSRDQVPALSPISYPELTDKQLGQIKDAIFTSLYNSVIAPLNVSQQMINQWAFLNMLNAYRPVQDTVPDPLLNTKPLIKRIIPASLTDEAAPIGSYAPSQGASALAIQAIGLSNPHLENLLNKALLTQTIKELNQNQLNNILDEAQQNEFYHQLLLLSASLLGTNSLQSLLPSINPITPYLANLPKNSPAYSILFSLSFVNRIQELTQNQLTSVALETLIDHSPQFAQLTAEQKTALTNELAPILNLSLLMMATKLLAANLGETNLTAQLLSSILPSSIDPSVLNPQSPDSTLQPRLKHHFIEQGYQSQEAQFLAQVGSELVSQGPLAPSATAISPQTIQTSLLTDSIKANLVLAGFSLDQSNRIASGALQLTLTEEPQSYSHFVAELETNLRLAGAGKYALDTAMNAVILPAKTPLSSTPVSQTEISQTLTQQVQSILAPQLGSEVSRSIAQELNKTLFGITQLDEATRKQEKSPLSLTSIMKEQVSRLAEKQPDQLAESFKEFMRDSLNLNAFLEKLMDPAHLFVFSIASGIMYAGNEPSNWKRTIDIPI